MDAVYHLGRATVSDVLAEVPDPPSYSTVRAMLGKLQAKGFVRHEQDGPRYVYRPTIGKDRARLSALRRLRDTFFNGSSEQVMVALLDDAGRSQVELERLAELIDRARSGKGEKR